MSKENNISENLDDLDFDFEDSDFDVLDNPEDLTVSELKTSREQENIKEAISNYDKAIINNALDMEDEEDSNDDSSTQQVVEDVKEVEKDRILYVLTDRLTSNLMGYFRGAGLPVTRIFSSIQDIRDTLLLQTDPCRLVIMETGLGKFTSVNSRAEILDMLGLSDEENKIIVFYTDSALKSETKDSLEIDYKSIKWFKYASTAETVARLLLMKEHYIDMYKPKNDEVEEVKDILNKKALTMTERNSMLSIGIEGITTDQIVKNISSEEYAELQPFKVKY